MSSSKYFQFLIRSMWPWARRSSSHSNAFCRTRRVNHENKQTHWRSSQQSGLYVRHEVPTFPYDWVANSTGSSLDWCSCPGMFWNFKRKHLQNVSNQVNSYYDWCEVVFEIGQRTTKPLQLDKIRCKCAQLAFESVIDRIVAEAKRYFRRTLLIFFFVRPWDDIVYMIISDKVIHLEAIALNMGPIDAWIFTLILLAYQSSAQSMYSNKERI